MGTRFIIVAAARTGSNRLVAQLQAQPDVWCHGEIHQTEHCWVTGPAGWNGTFPKIEQELLALRKSNLSAFYSSVFSISHGRKHVGFKALFGRNNSLELTKFAIQDTSTKKIVLTRQNVLAVYASTKAAEQSGAWNPERMARVARPKIEFLKDEFDELRNGYLANYQLAGRLLFETKQMVFSLNYTEINYTGVLSEMLHFIGANQRVEKLAALPIRGSSDILSRFSNPEVAERYLREHGLMHWAHEHDAAPGDVTV